MKEETALGETMKEGIALGEATEISQKERLKQRILTEPRFGDPVQFVLAKIGNLENKVILDNGCGLGAISVMFAHDGGYVIGVDKRQTAIDKAKSLAQSHNTEDRCSFIICNSESLPIAGASIDVIFSRSTMQYMDAEKVINEYMRVLKPSGIVAIIENLRYNPLINVYRLYRTLTAKASDKVAYVKSITRYMSVAQVEKIAGEFMWSDHREYHLFRMISLYIPILSNGSVLARHFDVFISYVDNKLFKWFPLLRRFAWFTALICQEKKVEREGKRQ